MYHPSSHALHVNRLFDINVAVMIALLLVSSTRVGMSLRKVSLLTLRINLLPRGNRYITSKKPATERTSAQGTGEYANPSRSDRKPPEVLQPASSRVFNTLRTPAPGRLF